MNVETADGDQAVSPPTTDETFTLLSNVYRRRLLVVLLSDPEVDPDRLVPDPEADLPARLYHVHLPKLDDAGLIDWHRDRETVGRGDRFDAVRPTLELLADNPARLPPGWV